MLVTCLQCKKPVFVSSQALDSGSTLVACSMCNTRLQVFADGQTQIAADSESKEPSVEAASEPSEDLTQYAKNHTSDVDADPISKPMFEFVPRQTPAAQVPNDLTEFADLVTTDKATPQKQENQTQDQEAPQEKNENVPTNRAQKKSEQSEAEEESDPSKQTQAVAPLSEFVLPNVASGAGSTNWQPEQDPAPSEQKEPISGQESLHTETESLAKQPATTVGNNVHADDTGSCSESADLQLDEQAIQELHQHAVQPMAEPESNIHEEPASEDLSSLTEPEPIHSKSALVTPKYPETPNKILDPVHENPSQETAYDAQNLPIDNVPSSGLLRPTNTLLEAPETRLSSGGQGEQPVLRQADLERLQLQDARGKAWSDTKGWYLIIAIIALNVLVAGFFLWVGHDAIFVMVERFFEKEPALPTQAKIVQDQTSNKENVPSTESSLGDSPSTQQLEEAERHYRQGNQYLMTDKEAPAAIVEFKKCIAIMPSHGLAYRSLGIAYMTLGQEHDAVRAYEKFVELLPDNRDAKHVKNIIADYYRRHFP